MRASTAVGTELNSRRPEDDFPCPWPIGVSRLLWPAVKIFPFRTTVYMYISHSIKRIKNLEGMEHPI